ncbi:PRKR-interacting protein 1 homolog [Musca vetustissima]|uniref:PRKR-interacting protein 1 homolog n=1 Tax=Musca vetustissima TaxID=27455 RepID=UPI002AB6315A|nr:PRKR-interacting protein 1 homolog [Musca vetustissima]
MSLIKNLVKEPERKDSKSDNDSDGEKKPRPIIKSAIDLQRLKLEKLMKNPDKPVIIPEHRKEKDYMASVPTFVRNVMGSSAGAGSGEFHVYRHLRRKEYARQKMIQQKSLQEQLDDEYQQKIEENRRKAEEKTAKKRAKRLKKKQRAKKPRQQKAPSESTKSNEDDGNTSSDCSEDNDNDNKANDDSPTTLTSNESVENNAPSVNNADDCTKDAKSNSSDETPLNKDTILVESSSASTAATKDDVTENDKEHPDT